MKMNVVKVLDGAISTLEITDNSIMTHKDDELAERLYDYLRNILTPVQQEVLDELYEVCQDVEHDNFYDGMLYGFKLAKCMNEILKTPESVFEEMRSSWRPLSERHKNAFKILRNANIPTN